MIINLEESKCKRKNQKKKQMKESLKKQNTSKTGWGR